MLLQTGKAAVHGGHRSPGVDGRPGIRAARKGLYLRPEEKPAQAPAVRGCLQSAKELLLREADKRGGVGDKPEKSASPLCK